MLTNSIYEPKLVALKDELTTIEAKIPSAERDARMFEDTQSHSEKKYRHSKVCLIISLALTTILILIIVFSIINYSSDFAGVLITALIVLHFSNLILFSISQDSFSILMLVFTFTPLVLVSGFIGLFLLIREIKANSKEFDDDYERATRYRTVCNNLIKQREDTKKEISKTENLIAYADKLYQQAIKDGNANTMEKAADAGSVAALEYLDNKGRAQKQAKGKELYDKAMSTKPIDDALIEKAAELDYAPAGLYFGRKLHRNLKSKQLTETEKDNLAEKVATYLEDVAADDLEAEYLWIRAKSWYDPLNFDYEYALSRLRVIKGSQKLPKHYNVSIKELIEDFVEVVDNERSRVATRNVQQENQKVQFYCTFNNCGICTRKSSIYRLAHCNYQNSPYLCSDAKAYGGLQSEVC